MCEKIKTLPVKIRKKMQWIQNEIYSKYKEIEIILAKIITLMVLSIIPVIILLFIFSALYSFNAPDVINIDPTSINESFTINDTSNESIKDIIIKNIGPNPLNLSIRLETSEHIRRKDNESNITNGSYINMSLYPYPLLKINSGEVKFLSVDMNASKARLRGDYRAAIIISTDNENIHETVPVMIKIAAAKSGNSSISKNADKKDNKTAS